jgi:UDP:flavonoid glycosyltransferase YjiC (YdhE family)
LLGFLVALPSFGIDMSLPALTAMGAALGVAPERAGLMMSLFMLGFAVAPLFYGPASDRYGRKPVVVFACALFVIAALTVPSFEFPRNFPPSVHFIGTPPIIPDQAPLPRWAHELDGSRKVVLVTQGTLANHNFGLLIGPTLAALANEPDLLVIATAGGRPVDAIPGPIPANARLSQYLPFEWVLPKVDVFVTNGGYGSVNQAMSFGIPLVTAGLTEDKADVNARVAWSGVGIDLATNEPTPQALREAVRTVLENPNYRQRASSMADEFGGIETRSEILRTLDRLSHAQKEDELRWYDTVASAQRRRVGRRLASGA